MMLTPLTQFIHAQEGVQIEACDWLANQWGALENAISKINPKLEPRWRADERGSLAGIAAVKVQAYFDEHGLAERAQWAEAYAPMYTRLALAHVCAWGANFPLVATDPRTKTRRMATPTARMIPPKAALTDRDVGDLSRWMLAARSASSAALRRAMTDAELAASLALLGIVYQEAERREEEASAERWRVLMDDVRETVERLALPEFDEGKRSLQFVGRYYSVAEDWKTAIHHANAEEAARAARERQRADANRRGKVLTQGQLTADGRVYIAALDAAVPIGDGIANPPAVVLH